MPKSVREPIQVYLSTGERAALERAAAELGVSRSEALRRGIEALTARGHAGTLGELVSDGLIAPATAGPGEPPPSAPVACAVDLLDELARDRGDR